ncbi:LOW QUALITY PROTEIN: histidine kinase [Brevundimonas abyssalis TAR-001]|uniref:histidine kinase n=2 Tax=Brevundimonas TaxID=41275 RepID=A0A8E0TSF5_9CAUL|nr:LOW QUALITY PROTEIN: histidine kinase [Brevundimonas abyssalis TAR-001]
MAEADIAFVAAAGAAGLALSVSAWAWRLRNRMLARASAADARQTALESRLADRDAGLGAFGEIYLGLTADGEGAEPQGEPADIRRVRAVLLGDGEGDLLMALVASAPENADRLARLQTQGAPCDFLARTPRGILRVQGRAAAGAAWLKLSSEVLRGHDGADEAEPLTELSPVPSWRVDGTGRLVWANRAWLEEVKAESVADAVDRGLGFDRGADALIAEARGWADRKGSAGPPAAAGGGRGASSPNRWAGAESGEALGAAAFALDVTEAEETRDTLRRHVEGHDETLNHLADAVAIFGPSKRLAYHNTAFQQLFGIDPAWLDDRPTHAELLDRLRQRRQLPERDDYPAWKAHELEFYGATEAAPDDSWSLPDGRTLRVVRQPHPLGGVLLLFSDITGELDLRSRYNAQIQVQRATLDKLNDAVAVFGSDGRLRLHNEAFETFWGVTADQLGEASDFDSLAELCKRTAPDAALWLGLKARVADPDPESRVAVSGETRTEDGRLAAWQTRPLPDGATLVAFADVTARRELEQALTEREAALRESQELKRQFVGSVSYELRTPLTTIVGYSELLEAQGLLDERTRQHAGAIRVAANQLARSIDDVLDMAQIDAGEMDLSLGDVQVCDVLEQCAERVRARVEGRGGVVEVVCPDKIGAVRADQKRLVQALDHLLDNAARSISEGGRVTLEAARGVGETRFRVTDTGHGIPYHLQAHVFDRYIQRERGGPGVALALVKALIELHGGWAELESEPGRGASFILHLPHDIQPAAAHPELGLELQEGRA